MPAQHYLVPGYILNFKCSCCTECCKRWRITIDKQTVDKYDQLAATDEELSAMLARSLKKDKGGQASVKLQHRIKKITEGGQTNEVMIDTMVCPFLDGDGLCVIQKKHGIDALSDTCKIFPRNIYLTERGYEMSLTYACPEAARSLKDKSPVQLFHDPEGFGFPELNSQYGKIGDLLDRKKAGKTNYFIIEEVLIDIIQFREIDLDTRIILTGIVIDKLKDGDIGGIKRYLQNIDPDLVKQLKSLPSQPLFMMKLVKEAVDKRLLTSSITEKAMGQLLVAAYNQLKLLNEPLVSDTKVQYFLDGYHKHYQPFANEISHVYENYFFNFIFSKKFYVYKYLDAYFLMMFFYVIIRFFAVCSCMAEEKNVDEDTVITVINAVERSIGHNKTYYDDVLRLIKEGGYHRLPYVLSLVNL